MENYRERARALDQADDVRREIDGQPPRQHDGRNIGPSAGVLHGEGALQRVERLAPEKPVPHAGPLESSSSDGQTYYGLPSLKETVWKGSIPAYFYVGGLSGAAAALGSAAQLFGGRRLAGLRRRARLVAFGGSVVSAALLIEDLGRPARFLHMLRVFRATSPMSVGSWILSAFGATTALAAAPLVLPPSRVGLLREGPFARAPDLAGAASGVFGLGLAGYTAVLLANTAVPVWQGARTSLPPLFLASAAGSAEAALSLFASNRREERVLHRFGAAAKAVELAAFHALEAEVGRSPRALAPLRSGAAGALWTCAKVCTAASLLLSLRPRLGSSRARRYRKVASALLGTAGAVCTRFAVFQAGRASARDPRATFEQQRLGLGAAEVGRAAPAPA